MTEVEGHPLLVRDLRIPPIPTVSPTATLQDVARTMLRERSPGVLLMGDGSLLTEHDVVRAIARGDSCRAAACAFATPEPRQVAADASALEAVELMVRHQHRLLVVRDRDDASVGLITLIDAVAGLLDRVDVPHWLPALRIALRVDPSRL